MNNIITTPGKLRTINEIASLKPSSLLKIQLPGATRSNINNLRAQLGIQCSFREFIMCLATNGLGEDGHPLRSDHCPFKSPCEVCPLAALDKGQTVPEMFSVSDQAHKPTRFSTPIIPVRKDGSEPLQGSCRPEYTNPTGGIKAGISEMILSTYSYAARHNERLNAIITQNGKTPDEFIRSVKEKALRRIRSQLEV